MRQKVLRGAKVAAYRVASNGLLWSIVTALVLGLAFALAAQWMLRRYIKTSDVLAAPIDITKVALTVVAGVGGVVALVIAYRRQRDLEQGRFVERFGAAAAQLGAADVAIRIAGVYAMAGVANESRGPRRQQCIDVLCGYLRLPYDADHGTSGRTRFVVKAPRVDHGRVRGETEEHIEYRQNDREVRQTIVRSIADHLRPEAEYSWSTSYFDFRTAHLEDADFGNTTFSGNALFVGATFSGYTRFGGATFSSNVMFVDATFSGGTSFSGASFSGDAWFVGATFSGGVVFVDATFTRPVMFVNTTFARITRFRGATFSRGARFSGATFSGDTSFQQTNFGTEAVSFGRPRQWGPPAPKFDWDKDSSQKPANVEPQDWPPTLAGTPPGPSAG